MKISNNFIVVILLNSCIIQAKLLECQPEQIRLSLRGMLLIDA